MFKNALTFLVLAMLVAMPATAIADTDWLGTSSSDFSDSINFSGDPTGGGAYTTQITVTGGTVPMPVIDAVSDDIVYGLMRIHNGAVLTQTDKTCEWLNATGTTQKALALYDGTAVQPSTLHMTGGVQIADRVGVGDRSWPGFLPRGIGQIDIWGRRHV